MTPFEQNIINIYQEQGKKWLANLPHLIHKIAKEWELIDLKPVENLSFNYVLFGFQHKKPIVLKLGLDKEALAQETAALKIFANYSGMSLIDSIDGVILLECAMPGTSLKDLISHKHTLTICCNVMKRLHLAPLPQHGFPHISQWLEALDKPWELPSLYLEKARWLKGKLHIDNANDVLLHGDLHHDNILFAGREWKVIDPKGVIGHPIHEIWRFVVDFEKDIPFIAKELNLEPATIM